MQIDLNGRNALVTGGTRGIGRAISCTLAGAGARLACIYQSDQATAESTIAELNSRWPVESGPHFARQADQADGEQIASGVQRCLDQLGGALDILVLNAAASTHGALAETPGAEWSRVFDVNVRGAQALLSVACPVIRPGGSIIFISSGAGHDPIAGLSAYSASKAAVNQMAMVLAQEIGPQGVRVNVVSPGHTEKHAVPADSALWSDAQREAAAASALRRLVTADDVANVVLFFASELSASVTGQWIRVNAGRV